MHPKRNDDMLERQRKFLEEKDELVEMEELENKEDGYINAPIYLRMWQTQVQEG